MSNFLGIIPARSGSKGIINKNRVKIGNKELIRFTFEAAENSDLLFKCVLTSNDAEIIEISKEYSKIETPFVRPEEISGDNSTTVEVIDHVLEWYKYNEKYEPKNIILLQPTSPFRNSEDINRAINQYEENNLDSLISVCKPWNHPSECFIVKEGKLKLLTTNKNDENGRQSYSDSFFIDGGIYICSLERYFKMKNLFDQNSSFIEMDQIHAIDIDTEFDLELARAVYSNFNTNNKQDNPI